MGIIAYSINAYLKNLKLISFFSIPFLIAFLIPLYVQTPTFPALGAILLRTGSLPDVSEMQAAVMLIAFLLHLLLFSFAIVAINLVIKSERTLTHIGQEVIKGIEKYVFNVFWILLTEALLFLAINLFAFELRMQETLVPVLVFLVSLPVFYVPAALVIDDLRPFRALEKSIAIVISKFPYLILWLLIGLAFLSFLGLILFAIPGFSKETAHLLLLIINSLFLLPFLVVFQSQIYISKYTILR
jgi:hypothetical protein